MRRSSDYVREFCTGWPDIKPTAQQRGEIVGNVVGFALVFGLLGLVLWALFQDCGGGTC